MAARSALTDWSVFYERTGADPRETLLFALDLFGRPGVAVDLGCGTGRDTYELLRRGWRVVAIDGEHDAIERLASRVPQDALDRLETIVAPFDEAAWPEVDLVNSSFALPFCPPQHFSGVWERIVGSVRAGGRFSGQLFGERDQWAVNPQIMCLTRAKVEELFRAFELERFDEVETDGTIVTGEPKHWHVFHVVARRRP
jgi:tellurite methyltransferase